MKAIVKKILLINFVLLPCACAHYPQQYGYYPGNRAYNSGYNDIYRNQGSEIPNHDANSYGQGRGYAPNSYRQDHVYNQSRHGNDYSGRQQVRGYEHHLNNANNRRHDDDGSGQHDFGRRNHD